MPQVYAHDCPNCRFLGHTQEHDVFLCVNADGPQKSSVVMRASSEPGDYQSLRYSEFARITVMPPVYAAAESLASRWLADNTEPTIGDAIFAKLELAEAGQQWWLESFLGDPVRQKREQLEQQTKRLRNLREVASYI